MLFSRGIELLYPAAERRAADNGAGILDGDSASTPSLGNGVLDWRLLAGDNAAALSLLVYLMGDQKRRREER